MRDTNTSNGKKRRLKMHRDLLTVGGLQSLLTRLQKQIQLVQQQKQRYKLELLEEPPLPEYTCIAEYYVKATKAEHEAEGVGYKYWQLSNNQKVFAKVDGKTLTRVKHLGSDANPQLYQAIQQLEQTRVLEVKWRSFELLVRHLDALQHLETFVSARVQQRLPLQPLEPRSQILSVLCDYLDGEENQPPPINTIYTN